MDKLIALLAILVIQIILSIVVIMQWGWGLEIHNAGHLIWGYAATVVLTTVVSLINKD